MFLSFLMLLFLLRLLILDLLYLMSLEESDSLNDESYDDGSDSGFSSTYSFPAFSLCFDDSVVHVRGLGSGVFLPTGVDLKCDTFRLLYLYQLELNPKVVDSSKCSGA